MDWLTLLLAGLFFLLPLIQTILERRGKDSTLPRVPAESEPEGPGSTEVQWSEGWGEWPTAPAGAEGAEGDAAEEQLRELPVPVEAVSLEPLTPRPVPVPEPAVASVSLESLTGDGAAELHALPLLPTAPALLPARPGGVLGLSDRRAIRRAVVLTEVLGPPRALRDPEA